MMQCGFEKSAHLFTVMLITDQRVHKKEDAFELNPLNPETVCYSFSKCRKIHRESLQPKGGLKKMIPPCCCPTDRRLPLKELVKLQEELSKGIAHLA